MENIIALVLATIVLIAIPGPNVALIVANSLQHGLRIGIVTSLGTTVGIGAQLVIAVAGLAALVELAANALQWIKWAGVVYLLYLGVTTWREKHAGLENICAASEGRAFWRGVMLAVLNPKTLLFNAAFLPQFVGTGPGAVGELYFVAMVYLCVLLVGDALWAVFAAGARRFIARFSHLRNRIIGALLIGASAGLALSHRGD